MEIGAVIKQFRIRAGYRNIRAAAEALGTDSGYLSQIETGKKYPSVRFMERLAAIYKVPVGVMFFYTFSDDMVKTEKLPEYWMLKSLMEKIMQQDLFK